jgi:hypothetical protein
MACYKISRRLRRGGLVPLAAASHPMIGEARHGLGDPMASVAGREFTSPVVRQREPESNQGVSFPMVSGLASGFNCTSLKGPTSWLQFVANGCIELPIALGKGDLGSLQAHRRCLTKVLGSAVKYPDAPQISTSPGASSNTFRTMGR